MTTLPLQLRYNARPQRPVCARFLPGDDPAAWLRDMANIHDTRLCRNTGRARLLPSHPCDVESPIPARQEPRPPADPFATDLALRASEPVSITSSRALDYLALYVVPASSQDVRPRGLLVARDDGAPLPDGAPGHAYGLVAGKLFVPVEASFFPAVADHEWAALLDAACVAYVWHPIAGLVGFEPGDRLRASDLLQPPPESGSDWGRAEPGLSINSRLYSVALDHPPTLDDIIASGRDDIGTKAGQRRRLPRAPTEALGRMLGGAAAGLAAAAIGALARLARWIARHAPAPPPRAPAKGAAGGARRPTWLSRLDEWANKTLLNSAHLFSARMREIRRLMHLLESDPDEGLKYALPMGGPGGAHRGLAMPGSRLFGRLVDFSLFNLGGGGPVDYWDMPPDVQLQLVARYRSLAEREIRLGRHRRAAYIYAELLGDLSSAAATLADGGHYREAAVLYRDRLNRAWDAAKCLERGGLLHEAIEIYEDLHRYVEVGDLYTRLEQPDDARDAYRRAVDERLRQRDHVTAATLLDQKLAAPDEALAALDSGWPDSAQARQCLDQSFQLIGRLGRHDEAARRVRALREDPPPARRLRDVVESFAETAGGYPDATVRVAAADAARVITSHALISRHDESPAFLRALERLAPEDRLLPRDCRRFLRPASSKTPIARAPRAVRSARSAPPRPVRTIRLPEGVEWSRAVATSAGFYIAGYRSRELVLVRGAWDPRDEELTLVSWRSRVLSGAPLLLSVDEAASPAVRLFLIGGPPLPPRSLPPTRTFTNFGSVETPGWLGDDSRGMDSAGGVTWVIDATLTLKGFNREGVPVVNRTLVPSIHELQQLAEGAPPFLPVPLHAREGSVHLGIGSHLIGVNRVDQHYALAAAGPIRSIVGSASFTRPRLAVFLDDAGGFVFWPTFHGGTHQPLPEDLIDARGVFLRDGRLLVYTADTWSLYLTQHGRLQLDREMSAPEADVHEMLATPTAGQFAACSRRGSLAVYEADR